MTLARLLVAVLLVCSAPAFAQKQSDSLAAPAQAADASKPAAVTSSEPWRLIPNPPADANSGTDPLDRLRIDEFRIDRHASPFKLDARADKLVSGLDGQLDTDTTCYTMRSYVVARDDKDSDSTHPTGYSTCQPASRYHLKTADGQGVSLER